MGEAWLPPEAPSARSSGLWSVKNGKEPDSGETDVQMDSVESQNGEGKDSRELHHILQKLGDKVILEDFDLYCASDTERLELSDQMDAEN